MRSRYFENFIAVSGRIANEFCIQQQRIQKILQIVRDAGRHLAERAKFLRPDQSVLRNAQIVKRLLKLLMLVSFVQADCGQVP